MIFKEIPQTIQILIFIHIGVLQSLNQIQIQVHCFLQTQLSIISIQVFSNADWVSNAGTNMIPGIGYAIRSESAGDFLTSFNGLINQSEISINVYFNSNVESTDPTNVWSTEGDNLVGNPYASAIDWDLIIN